MFRLGRRNGLVDRDHHLLIGRFAVFEHDAIGQRLDLGGHGGIISGNDIGDHCGDVVTSAALVGCGDEFLGCLCRVGFGRKDRGDGVGVDLVEQPIAAEQVAVADLWHEVERVDFDIFDHAERPGDDVAAVVRRLPYPYGGGGRSQGAGQEDKSTRVSLDVEFGQTGFSLGDLVRVTVVLEARPDVLWLPPQAIRTFEGRRFVVVQDEGGQRRVDVSVGIQGDDRVEIKEGLSEGDIIVGQ